MAVGALAVGPFLYRALLPAQATEPAAGCGFLALTGGLVALLAGAAIWQLRRRRESRESREEQLDRRLWEVALGGEAPPPPATGAAEDGGPEAAGGAEER